MGKKQDESEFQLLISSKTLIERIDLIDFFCQISRNWNENGYRRLYEIR